MKKINLLFAVLMLLMLGNTNKIFAETVDIDWSSYARSIDKVITTDENNPTYVYLYNVTSKQFITCGKSYGMQCIMANVGMKFYITKSGNSYIIHSNVTTPSSSGIGVGGCLGISWGDVYIDRSDNIYWKFNNVSSSTSTYYIQNNAFLYTDHYLTQNKVLKETTNKGENHSSEWMIITRQDYLTQTAQAKYEQIDVTGLLADSRFDRNSNDATSWKWGSGETGAASNNNENHAIGVIESYAQYGLDWDQYFAAEIDRESNTLSQTVTDLEEGIYRITCQGFYINSYDNANSYLYATNGSDESSILLKDISSTDYNSYYIWNYYKNYNITAGKIFLDGGEANYSNEVYIYIKKGDQLTFGLKKTGTDGYAFVDNFKLYYCGKNEIYLNEEGTEKSFNDDNINYPYPCRLNYRRAFTLGHWNAIVLPISLSGSQVRAAFGEDAQLSKLEGIDPARKSQILFKTVDLGKNGIEAGECYVIWLTKKPSVKMNDPYTYNNNNTNWKIYGPLYQIEGVTKKAGSPTKVEKEYTTTNGTLIFDGYYYKKMTTANDYVYYVTSGDMYYDNQSNFPIYATRWTLKDKVKTGAKYTFNFDGISEGNGTTAIENINTEASTNAATSNTVYNLNGQVVRTNSTSLEGLAKGIYIVNGKKYIVK